MSKAPGDLNRVPQVIATATSETITVQPRSGSVSVWAVIGGLVILAGLIGSEFDAWKWMYERWTTNPDNSHGLLVPFFSLALLWIRKEKRPSSAAPVSTVAFSLGVILIIAGAATKCVGIYCRMMTVDAISILPCLLGIALCYGGWSAARWTWPSVFFLLLMIPLPMVIGNQLGGSLQHIATVGSTYLMQLMGIPAVAEGNVIYLSNASLGVAEACSGIRMLMSFFALTTAICFLVERPAWEKCLIWISAPLIAVIANVLRITATGIAYEYGNEKLAEMIFHDLAGWLMMPVGLLLLWIELFLLSRLFPIVEEGELSVARQARSTGTSTGAGGPRRPSVR